MIRALAGVSATPVSDQTQVSAAAVVHCTRVVCFGEKSNSWLRKSQFSTAEQRQARYCLPLENTLFSREG